MKLKIILVRHAESIANAQNITQGQKVDEPLSEKGKIQTRLLCNRLKNFKIKKIYSSDLKRATHTAEEIARVINKKIICDKRLRERDHDNEGNEEFVKRCKSFLEDIKKEEGTVLVVAHGGTNRTILAISTGNRRKGAEVYNMAKQENACINIIELRDGNWLIKSINDFSHLEQ